jgi:hypothetical protein
MKFFMQGISAIAVAFALSHPALAAKSQWSARRARSWYAHQGPQIGANYIPSDAINTIEMWQKETFNPTRIDWELARAESIGFTSLRVFLNDLVWQDDPSGFAQRIETFLQIAAHHHIRPVFVLFDSCWNPHSHLGTQPAPLPGVHNSGWVQTPSLDALLDPGQLPRLRVYVQGIIGSFAKDQRVLAWDLWNEPDNLNSGIFNDPAAKTDAVLNLLPQVFAWARAVDPTQPLTSGVWDGDWSSSNQLRPIEKIQLGMSDIISFHSYDPALKFKQKVVALRRLHRPIFCTEYMARPLGSTVQTILPVAQHYRVSAFNWGFVSGKTQTIYPWDSWDHPYAAPPQVWFHDLLYPDGTPFDVKETDLIRSTSMADD